MSAWSAAAMSVASNSRDVPSRQKTLASRGTGLEMNWRKPTRSQGVSVLVLIIGLCPLLVKGGLHR
jgi:hypothetical protein